MYKIGQLIKSQPIKGIDVKKPLKTNTLEVLSISLEKGAVLPEHTSPKDAFILVLQGAVDFHIEGESYPIEALEDFSFPANTPHWVLARENSKLLVVR